MKIKVIYKSSDGINKKKDNMIVKMCKDSGFDYVGQGFNIKTNERDISFE